MTRKSLFVHDNSLDSRRFSEEIGSVDIGLTGVNPEEGRQGQQKQRAQEAKKGKSSFTADVLASIVNGISNVPDAMATSIMAGVSPIHGLYATIVAPTAGGLVQSSQLMVVGVTVAAAVLAKGATESYPEEVRLPVMFLLAILTGLFLVTFGFFKLGRLQKYISYSVMKGFLYGVGLLLILSQSPAFFGYTAIDGNAVQVFWNTLTNFGQWNMHALGIGVITLGLMLALRKTPVKSFASALALVAATLLTQLDYFSSVSLVSDISEIPNQLPHLEMPRLDLITPALVFSAFTMAILIAVQGLGVSQMSENPDGTPVNSSRDMIAQGAANIASGLVRGLPVGGSIGSTALNMSLGARSRISAILTGLWMVGIVWLFASYVEMVPMPALTSLILLAGAGAVNIEDSVSILKSGWASFASFVITMLCILLFNIPTAVGVGVVLSIVLFLIKSGNEVRVYQWTREPDGRIKESEAPAEVLSNQPMVLEVTGSLHFAGAQTLGERLPKVGQAENPQVIVRLREQNQFGATLIEELSEYAENLQKTGGKLYLTGLTQEQLEHFRQTEKMIEGTNVEYYLRTPYLHESTQQALDDAHEWLRTHQGNVAKATPMPAN